jgi:membrane protease YdiL (CAAX protease family)
MQEIVAASLPLAASFVPLVLAEVALGSPRLLARLPTRGLAWRAAAALGTLYAAASLALGTLDPLRLAIVVATALAALAALGAARGAERLTAADLAVFVVLWVPFDLRLTDALFPGAPASVAYDWCAAALTVLAATGYGRLRDLPGFSYRLAPCRRDLVAALGALLAFGALAVPAGLATGFLRFPPSHATTALGALSSAAEIFFLVAIPEEVYFRAVLQAAIARTTGRPRLALALASLAFGLTHWNNAETPATRAIYVALATLAGLFYGQAYRRTGAVIAPALAHAGVDIVWKLFLE